MKIPFIAQRKNITLDLFRICCFLLILVVTGCGDEYSSSDGENDLSNTGSYACSIKWPEDVPTLETTSVVSRAINCDEAGVATVAFTFYDGSGSYLTGDEWSCSLHQGTVHGIPRGNDRRLVVTGEDASGTVLYRGEATGIEIVAGQTTQGGEIEMEQVYGTEPTATITSPSDGSKYTEGDTITFSGTGEDAEDGTLTGTFLVWTSSRDDEIGTGTYFERNDLSLGTHTITLAATDDDGATATDSVSISVKYPWTMLNLPDTGQTQSYTHTPGEDSDYTINPPSYTDNGDGTVTDNVTGFMWQQEDDDTTRTWDEACSYCNDLVLAAYSDWRLPSKKELMSIVNYGTYSPSIDTTYFSATDAARYWSSPTYANNPSQAWSVCFEYGKVTYLDKSGGFYVRCVR
ncbi:hypothetical protein ES703_41439 [subsurface metagenome]